MEFIFFLIGLPALIVLIDFIGFLTKGKQVVNRVILGIAEIGSLIILPLLYAGFGDTNDCCNDSAVFSPQHQLTIGILMTVCLFAYFYSSYRKKIATPVLEILTNILLLTGIALNIVIAIHTNDYILIVLGNIPIILLAILVLAKNQQVFIQQAQHSQYSPTNKLEKFAFKILNLKPVFKFPVILILCLPVLIIIVTLLLLFGQKPDSVVRAFTDTYKHGLSQWDYKCDNVNCGGHYLCSVAAGGHKHLVKPKRLGIRNGNIIICNRQLLISNAFEDLIQENLPSLHKFIRTQYNKVGKITHRHYSVFNNPFVADTVYILMKPLEWLFLFALYTFTRTPENRIAKQYLNTHERQEIDRH